MPETPSAPLPDELLSRVLAGRYRVDRQLRRGGMGAVYVAHDLQEHKDVAVKVVRQALLEDPQALARFKREARLVTELSHENIVRSFDAGDDGGLLWIAMELLDGESLRERLDARGRMAWADTLPLVEQVAQALGAAHDQGIIHRDLKPENIMLVASSMEGAADTRAKLLDFGVAKQAHVEGQSSGTSNMTGTGLIVGTPGYVAPEVVLEGTTDDRRSDFYALGVVWFEMLTGQKPFTAKTAFALAMRHAHEPAPTPTSLVPYSPVPTPIERVVLRLLAKNPNDRPKDARELLITLATLAEESQRSLNATPSPSLLSGNPHDATVTDLADIHRTGVVPFVGTPKPATTDPRLSARPDMSGTGTPATAQFAPGMTPPGATPLPQLLAQVPKKTMALLLLGLVVFVGGVATVATVAANRGMREHDRDERESARAPQVPQVPQPNLQVPPSLVVPSQLPPPMPSPPPAPSSPSPPSPVPATAIVEEPVKLTREERRARKGQREKVANTPIVTSDAAVASDAKSDATSDSGRKKPSMLSVKPLPVADWTIRVEDGYPMQAPYVEKMPPGKYRLTIESKKLQKKLEIVADVKPNETTLIAPDFSSP